MAGTRLDPIDRMILAELQSDGRTNDVELAQAVGIPGPALPRAAGSVLSTTPAAATEGADGT